MRRPSTRGARCRPMADLVRIVLDGRHVDADEDASLLAALWNAGARTLRTSVGGTARGPLCAMGTCFECRVEVDGAPHVRACQTPVREGMRVELGARPSSSLTARAAPDEAPPLSAEVVVVGGGPAGARGGGARGRGRRTRPAARHPPAPGRPDLAPPRGGAAQRRSAGSGASSCRAPRRSRGRRSSTLTTASC